MIWERVINAKTFQKWVRETLDIVMKIPLIKDTRFLFELEIHTKPYSH